MMHGRSLVATGILAWFAGSVLVAGAAAAENWPHWRGPGADGISDSANLPVQWNGQSGQNIVWRKPLPSWSGGTPIIWGDRIFVTSASAPAADGDAAVQEEPQRGRAQGRGQRGRGRFGGRGFGGRGFGGRGRRDPGGPSVVLLCISKSDGNILWERTLDNENYIENKHNASSPSPVTDGKHVWVVTGTGVVRAFDFEGNQVWRTDLEAEYGDFGLNWGYGSSPILYQDKLIIEVLHGNNTDDPSYIVALSRATGDEVWRVERPTDAVRESPDAYTTPVIVTHQGRDQIVISGGDYVTGHDPQTGREIWRAGGLNPSRSGNWRIIASPFVGDGLVYASGRDGRPLLALKAGGEGDITASHLAWKWETRGSPDVPTPVCDGTNIYMIDDRGNVTRVNAQTGDAVWGPVRTAQGTVSSSPLLAGGRLYVINEQAVASVLSVENGDVLATNELDGEYTLSSFAVSGPQLFIRTATHLYCIGGDSSR